MPGNLLHSHDRVFHEGRNKFLSQDSMDKISAAIGKLPVVKQDRAANVMKVKLFLTVFQHRKFASNEELLVFNAELAQLGIEDRLEFE